jgi:hypothetical protein
MVAEKICRRRFRIPDRATRVTRAKPYADYNGAYMAARGRWRRVIVRDCGELGPIQWPLVC